MKTGIRKIDLHIHTTVSDGTDTPPALLEKVRDAGMDVFSVTDHDAFKAAFSIKPLLKECDPLFIPGVEFSCRDEQGKYHILGYGFDPEKESIKGVVELGHRLRMKKVRNRIDFLNSEFGFSFSEQDLREIYSLDNPGKPHIGNLMVKYGYAASKESAIRDYIDRVHFKSEYVRPDQAIVGILDAGGVPVLAHPFYGSGDDLILGDEMEHRLKRLMDFGLRGVEAFYSGFSDKMRNDAVELAERYGLYITVGSDYHGTNKLVRLGDTGVDEVTKFPSGLIRFLELFDIIG